MAKTKSQEESILNLSRRGFLGTTAVGGLSLAGLGLKAGISEAEAQGRGAPPKNSKDKTLLKGGVVLSLDPAVGDFQKADVLIQGKKILAVGPNLGGASHVVDCTGMIVMPGFVSTHNHQYEAVQRSLISDGLIIIGGDPDTQPTSTAQNIYESYTTVVQSIWTAGRIGPAANPQWDLGRSPYDPEDCYNAELIACLSQITQGITCGTDTSQCSHTPQHTDAMIQACFDSGRRTLFDYSNGINRNANQAVPPAVKAVPYNIPTGAYEFPDATVPFTTGQVTGLERIAKKYFSSKDQLVTLGFAGGVVPLANLPGSYKNMTGIELARQFGAYINAHNVGDATIPKKALLAKLAPFDDITLVHCVRWQDNSIAQLSYGGLGYPAPATSEAMKIWADNGGHISIAVLIEQQMRHGMPPFQLCLNHGILPSLSPDVDTNMTADPFSLMRGAFCLQRGLANDLAYSAASDPGNLPIPQLITTRQAAEMMTIAGAVGSGLGQKVGTLTPGKEADIVMLEYDNINYQPMNNAYGTVVTLMDTSAVKHVMIAGKMVYWNRKLVGVNVDRIIAKAVKSRDNLLARIQGKAWGNDTDIINRGMNSQGNPYRPAFLTSCCHNGMSTAPQYVLRP
ncbi:amidohydrolase family protein [Hyphomicrobium sp.]|uniref:amidohydrolase family protein n=1 Tax=Hyphomicrobium sp. TaxID=82 RepID=UPI001D6B72C3|nr:amidohydrolase family protein [Hyphomicrobium sp.]MBY0558929.1 amidohydrolase family protein [Hyphomicrobium sp.]